MKTGHKIQVYPSIENVHTSYKSLISNPPKGYEFIGNTKSKKGDVIDKLRSYRVVKKLYKIFIKIFKSTSVLNYSNQVEISGKADLVFSTGSVYNGNKNWILDIIDNPYCLAGYNYELFIRNKKRIESALLRENCKKIICANESSIKMMKKHFSMAVNNKVTLVRPGIKLPEKFKKINNGKIKLLIMGSITNPEDFYNKGGLEAVATFESLQKTNKDIELILRCKVPESIKSRILKNKGIKLIEDRIPFEDLINLYKTSDVFLLPSHTYMLMALLESMSYGIPVVILDTHGVRNYVKDNYSGFVISRSKKNSHYNSPSYPTNIRSKEFIASIKKIDRKVIEDLVKKTQELINSKKLRIKLGQGGINTIKDKFSISERNNKLKKVFDEAVK